MDPTSICKDGVRKDLTLFVPLSFIAVKCVLILVVLVKMVYLVLGLQFKDFTFEHCNSL